jgi:hypothetical protein
MKKIILAGFLFFICFINTCFSKDMQNGKYVYFPGNDGADFNLSLGMLFTTTHRDITEEVQFRIPAIDVNARKRLTKNFSLTARLTSQILQNHLALGLTWTNPLSRRVFFSVNDDIAFWEGWLKTEGFYIRANGFINYPGISAGVHCGKDVLLTLKGEVILTLSQITFVGSNLTSSEHKFYNGEALGVYLEQPFYHNTCFLLGFRTMYVNDFWQMWPLFETLDRNTFYPQMIMAVLL